MGQAKYRFVVIFINELDSRIIKRTLGELDIGDMYEINYVHNVL